MVNVIFSLCFLIVNAPSAFRRALVARAIAWANFRDTTGSAGGWIPMRWVINAQKWLTPFWILLCMGICGEYNTTINMYLIGHSTIAWTWLIKDMAAPDKGFDCMRLNPKGALGVWVGALGPYWVAPALITWRHIEVLLWWSAICCGVAIGGALVTFCADVHKARECEEAAAQDKHRFLVDTGPWAWSRHPGYFGELLSYGALAAMPAPWFFATGDWWALLPLALLGQVWTIVMVPNLCRLEAHMAQSRGDAWREYAARVPLLWPRIPRRVWLLLPAGAITWGAWQ